MPRTLTCDEVEALLPLVADGSLDAQHDPALFDHLATCDRCQESLVAHDLVSVALTQPAPRLTLRPAIAPRRRWPLAVAALLLLGIGVASVTFAGRPASPAPLIAQTKPAAATPTPAPIVDHREPVIDVEVITAPGSSESHPLYVIRRGLQVKMVIPPPESSAPSDAQAASYSLPQRY